MNYLLVLIGGGVGAVIRHVVNMLFASTVGMAYPWATLFINVSGSLLMGAVVEFAALKTNMPPGLRLFLTTGILGGYTTFSTFALEAGLLHSRGETLVAIGYVAASAALGVGGLFAGMALVRASLG